MALLWRAPGTAASRPGPRSSLDVDRIVTAAVGIADTEGLSALSIRRVAAEVGVPPMTLYSHVPGRGELVDLMVDRALGDLYPGGEFPSAGNWRARVEAVARANRQLFLRHPWVPELGRPLPGPNRMRQYEIELRAVDGMGLSEVQMDLLVDLVAAFVRGAVDGGAGAGGSLRSPCPQPVIDPEAFPTAARVAAGSTLPQDADPDRAFEFGLERLLDGIGVLMLNPAR